MSSSSKEPEANRDDIGDIKAKRRRASRARMLVFVRLADFARKHGFMPSPPPLEMFNHPGEFLLFAILYLGQIFSEEILGVKNDEKFVPDEPDVKNCCVKTNLPEMNDTSQKAKALNYDESNDKNSSTKLGDESQLEKRKEANQNKKAETSSKNCCHKTILPEMNDTSQKAKALNYDESIDKNSSTKLGDESQLEKRKEANQNKKAENSSKEQQLKGCSQIFSKEAKKNKAPETSIKEKLSKRASLKERSDKNIAKLRDMLSSEEDAVKVDGITNRRKSVSACATLQQLFVSEDLRSPEVAETRKGQCCVNMVKGRYSNYVYFPQEARELARRIESIPEAAQSEMHARGVMAVVKKMRRR
ncbi:hypothetical protein U9M48_006416 [Paspalum notatum var. saurae]|uniref:Uncharacterized protein n=1 Tax=Paspalum notatum var. saurae TaxID=547442 RepID=A0AAQ3SLS2_PASNO